jgi:hypothetical protein
MTKHIAKHFTFRAFTSAPWRQALARDSGATPPGLSRACAEPQPVAESPCHDASSHLDARTGRQTANTGLPVANKVHEGVMVTYLAKPRGRDWTERVAATGAWERQHEAEWARVDQKRRCRPPRPDRQSHVGAASSSNSPPQCRPPRPPGSPTSAQLPRAAHRPQCRPPARPAVPRGCSFLDQLTAAAPPSRTGRQSHGGAASSSNSLPHVATRADRQSHGGAASSSNSPAWGHPARADRQSHGGAGFFDQLTTICHRLSRPAVPRGRSFLDQLTASAPPCSPRSAVPRGRRLLDQPTAPNAALLPRSAVPRGRSFLEQLTTSVPPCCPDRQSHVGATSSSNSPPRCHPARADR